MQYKPIENCHMENAILGKDFNLGTTNSFFHVFNLVVFLKKISNYLRLITSSMEPFELILSMSNDPFDLNTCLTLWFFLGGLVHISFISAAALMMLSITSWGNFSLCLWVKFNIFLQLLDIHLWPLTCLLMTTLWWFVPSQLIFVTCHLIQFEFYHGLFHLIWFHSYIILFHLRSTTIFLS